jgi:hypothetical protein
MKDNFLLKQLAQAVVESHHIIDDEGVFCEHCDANLNWPMESHKPHCIVLVAEQILKGNEE